MIQPWLIQRCELREGKLKYDYMGSHAFEVGEQPEALKRIFVAGVAVGSASVVVGGKEVPVYMVASEGFPFFDYQFYLQQLSENNLNLQEHTYFDDALKVKVGLSISLRYPPRTNAWFDFRNDVLWTLTENDQKALIIVLEGIRNMWIEKK